MLPVRCGRGQGASVRDGGAGTPDTGAVVLPVRVAARTTGALLAGFGTFQACLAGGAPWGRFAYGGQHEGRLPDSFRRISAVAAPVYGVMAVVVASEAGSPRQRRTVASGLAIFMAIGTALNLASRSPAERMLWTPLCALTAVLAGAARPPAQSVRATSVTTGGR
jgi:hypothetical protein